MNAKMENPVREEKQIEREISVIKRANIENAELAKELYERLEVVMRPKDSGEGSLNKELIQEICPLAYELYEESSKMHKLYNILHEILDRLEV